MVICGSSFIWQSSNGNENDEVNEVSWKVNYPKKIVCFLYCMLSNSSGGITMSNEMRVYPVQALNEALADSLSRLLIDVVADSASIGFLPPLGYQEAAAYWNNVLEDGVVLWIAEKDGVPVGTVQLHLAQKLTLFIVRKLQSLWCIRPDADWGSHDS